MDSFEILKSLPPAHDWQWAGGMTEGALLCRYSFKASSSFLLSSHLFCINNDSEPKRHRREVILRAQPDSAGCFPVPVTFGNLFPSKPDHSLYSRPLELSKVEELESPSTAGAANKGWVLQQGLAIPVKNRRCRHQSSEPLAGISTKSLNGPAMPGPADYQTGSIKSS